MQKDILAKQDALLIRLHTDDNNIALLYEGPGCDIIYVEFHIGFLLGKR